MKFFLILFFIILNGCANSTASESNNSMFPLTRNKIKNLLENPPTRFEKLEEETISGCVSVPARGFFQKLFVGLESTGESCSITIHPNNKISVNFLSQKNIPLISTSQPGIPTDTFVAELDNGQVLIVQQVKGRVVSVTQTIYDSQGTVVYQNSGEGDFIRECQPYMTNSEKRDGQCLKTP